MCFIAKDKRKGGRHTNLVLPGDQPKPKKTKPAKPKPQTKEVKTNEAAPPRNETPPVADNTIVMPSKQEMQARRRRKKYWKRARLGILLVFIVWLVVFFASGTYLTAWVALSEGWVNIQVSLQSGNGFPMEYAMVGFKDAKGMENGGFAVLGEKDLGIVSSTGRELLRIQHGYVTPQITTSKNRVCIYNRGGREYKVLGRTGEFYTGTAENSIMFAQLSPGGWLALCTSSRSRFEVALYNTTLTGEAVFKWSSVNDIPLITAFHTDNRTMALGCITSKNGAMNSTIYVFKTNRIDKSKLQLAAIQVENAIPLQMEFIAPNRILVLYNQGYAAVYNTQGEELARYDYGGRLLQSAHTGNGVTGLVFSSGGQDTAHLVLVDQQMRLYSEVTVPDATNLQVLCTEKGAFVLDGQEVLAYGLDGALAGSLLLEGRASGLVYGGVPLAIAAGGIYNMAPLFGQQTDSPLGQSSSAAPSDAGGQGSTGSTPQSSNTASAA